MPDVPAENNRSTASSTLFPSTHWSVVLAAGGESTTASGAALEHLCRTYWPPIYAYLRRRGHAIQDAEDLTQGFFARLLEGNSFVRLDPAKGRFRSWLLAVLKHQLGHEREKTLAQKRGGGVPQLPFDDVAVELQIASESARALEPDRLFERQWALALLAQAVRRLQASYLAEGRLTLYEQLSGYVSGEPAVGSYAEAARRLGMSESAVRSAIHRMRQRYQQLIREEVAQTVSVPAEVDDELRHLIAVLGE